MSRLDEALELVAISSVSRNEASIASLVESRLRQSSSLDVERIGDNVVARTTGHHATRLIVAGHIDTVPGEASEAAIVGDQLRGVGACDMKGSIAVMLELALDPTPRSVEVTWIFYAREEISRSESGLVEIAELRPELLIGDAAVLAEPTGGVVEAGCQGTLRVSVTVRGRRAHTARPFTGRNAIHRAGDVILRVASYEPRVAVIDGVRYTEQLQAVGVDGGVAPNVVPDSATVTLNHRVAPDRTREEASAWLREFLGDLVEDGDEYLDADWAPSAPPSLTNARLDALVKLTGSSALGKVGWTDVATFQELNIPATNFGAGDPLFAHHSEEFVTLTQLDEFARVLRSWLA
ncbi:MAG TPA: succinyl-diaminopimelate desuccinylase [Acidimicrobiales bacterium]|nr:succinyl-diaminopimelate desuccinylase [Acidimicrobiales bacterium]